MGIKVGDKVRVSKAIPNMYLVGFGYAVIGDECKVREIYEGSTLIKWKNKYIVIPTKYLIKVEDEAKEPKFKVGDKVVVHYSTGDKIGRIQEVLYDGCYDVDYGGGCTGHHIIESRLYPTPSLPPRQSRLGT